jgi:integrator complex subunit 1
MNSSKLVADIATVLKTTEVIKSEHPTFNKKGLLVDWLAEIDAEMISITEDLQLNLLFNKEHRDFRPYLLSLLSHQSNWSTISRTVDILLESFSPFYDPTSVLDFIDAIIRNPKLWQGRDKTVPKHEQIEYIINLKETQMHTFIEYVMAEGNSDLMNNRVKLFLQCIEMKYNVLPNIVHYVELKASPYSKSFLQHIYLNLPPMKSTLSHVQGVYDEDLRNVTTECVGDKFVQCMLTTITSLSNQRDVQQMSQEMELVMRKSAACHPTLLLRQISMLASLIQGRAHMDLHVLRNEYHIALFHQVLGILELLQPLVFESQYRVGLHNALDCYFSLLRYHGHCKEFYSILCRFINFIQLYISVNAKQAIALIELYTELLEDLSQTHCDVNALQQLVQGLSLLKHQRDFDNDCRNTPGVSSLVAGDNRGEVS